MLILTIRAIHNLATEILCLFRVQILLFVFDAVPHVMSMGVG